MRAAAVAREFPDDLVVLVEGGGPNEAGDGAALAVRDDPCAEAADLIEIGNTGFAGSARCSKISGMMG